MPPLTFEHAYQAALGLTMLFGGWLWTGVNTRLAGHEQAEKEAARERTRLRERVATGEAHHTDVVARLSRIERKLDRALNGH